MSVVAREKVAVTGAGRTDAGVHASFYVAHFDTENQDLDNDKIIYNLNCLLPYDIAVQAVYKTHPEAHARFDATSRTYKYYLIKKKDPFQRQFATKATGNPDLQRMNEAASKLLEYEDFTSFSKLGTDVKTNNCKIAIAVWTEIGRAHV